MTAIDTDALDEAVRRFPKLLRCDFVLERIRYMPIISIYSKMIRDEYRLVLKEREKRRGH